MNAGLATKNMHKKLYLEFKKQYFQSGKIFSSSLSGQYHISCFVLCCVIAEDNPIVSLKIVNRCLTHLDNEFKEKKHIHSIDFTIENLCLAHFVCDCLKTKSMLSDFLNKYASRLEKKISANASDYYLLRYFNVEYYRINLNKNIELDSSVTTHISKVFETEWFLADTFDGNEQIPDLAYHCRNLQILMGAFILNKSADLLVLINKAVKALLSFGTEDGRICFYGRSANLVYGYASLYSVIKLIKNKKNYQKLEKMEIYFLNHFVNFEKSEIYVSENGAGDEKRLNFDSYVHNLVYQSFSLSRILLGTHAKYMAKINIKFKEKSEDIINYDQKSGFVAFKSDAGDLTLNLRGHPNAVIRPRDRRYLPLNLVSTKFRVPDPKVYYAEVYSSDRFIRKIANKLNNYFLEKIFRTGFGYCPIYYRYKTTFFITKYHVERLSKRNFLLTPLESSFGIGRHPIDLENLKCYIEFGQKITLTFKSSDMYSLQFPIFYFENDYLNINSTSVEFGSGTQINFNRPIADVKYNFYKFNTVNGVARRAILLFGNGNRDLKVQYKL